MKKKIVLIAIYVLTLALLVASGSTIAWLVTESGPVINTFAPSNIDITLSETNSSTLKMLPGTDLEKDPSVTVDGGSEKCWLFVKIDEDLGSWTAYGSSFTTWLNYSVISEWKPVSGATGVYYRIVDTSASDQNFHILVGDKVHVENTVTKSMMDDLYAPAAVYPTLEFTAYAVQYENVNDPAKTPDENAVAAWSIATTP